jgi:hypothetical protein
MNYVIRDTLSVMNDEIEKYYLMALMDLAAGSTDRRT